MTSEEIELFIDNRRASVDTWQDKESGKQRVAIFYWQAYGTDKIRVFEAGDNLEDVVKKCIDSEGLIKAGTPKVMKPPGSQSKTVTCFHCGNYYVVAPGDPSPQSCNGCGNYIY